MDTSGIILSFVGAIVGGAIGFGLHRFLGGKSREEARLEAENLLKDAKGKAKETLLEGKDEALKIRESAKREEREIRSRLEGTEIRLNKKEESLDQRMEKIEQVQSKLEQRATALQESKDEVERLKLEQTQKLESLAQCTEQEAKAILLQRVEEDSREELVAYMEKVEQDVRAESAERAKEIIGQAIQKYAGETVAESTVTIVTLPNDEMKGRVIGREGRNINAFERIAGVDVIVDDSPGTVVISGFDMVRRYIAKLALEKLISDGRIHPTRIEETVEKSKAEVVKMIKEIGEKVIYDTGVTGLHPDLVKILGRLRFRTSHGQNVLKHAIEVCYLAGSLAGELGADIALCKKAGLLHDIGKAVDHEISGSHSMIGRDIAKKYGMSDAVCHIIESHHDEVLPKTLEAIIVHTANKISEARPGAKREALESYIQRLTELERVASGFPGIKSAFAVQAGREIRVIVSPETIDDLAAQKLARAIAEKIEKDLEYPGQIKINVLRETRVVEYAK